MTGETDSYTLREPLLQPNADFPFAMLAWDVYQQGNDRFVIEVKVSDTYPSLTSEEALLGIRHIDSSVNSVRLKCAEQSIQEPAGQQPQRRTASAHTTPEATEMEERGNGRGGEDWQGEGGAQGEEGEEREEKEWWGWGVSQGVAHRGERGRERRERRERREMRQRRERQVQKL